MAEEMMDKPKKNGGYYPKFEATTIKRLNEQVSGIYNWANQTSSAVLAMQKSMAESVSPVMSVVGEIAKNIQTSGFFDSLRNSVQTFVASSAISVGALNVTIPQTILSVAEISTNYANLYNDAIKSLNVFPSLPTIKIPKLEVEERVDEDKLDSLLNKLNPKHSEILVSVWQSFDSTIPDRTRQSCSSMRQLINDVIDELTPMHGKREEKIKSITSKYMDSNMVNSFVKFIDIYIDCLNKGVHNKHTSFNDEAIEHFLLFGEGILLSLLKKGE